MPRLHVQIIGPDERLHSAETFDCACSAPQVWSYVASQARGLDSDAGMRIQVRDATGGLLLRTSVAAALLAEGYRSTTASSPADPRSPGARSDRSAPRDRPHADLVAPTRHPSTQR